jgi:hypothetical protein
LPVVTVELLEITFWHHDQLKTEGSGFFDPGRRLIN